jgi:hypothetical protein
MSNHFLFIFYSILIVFSTIGFGCLFTAKINKNFQNLNLGYQGIIGFFFITFISIISSFVFKHDLIHNSILHLMGLFFFWKYQKIIKINHNNIKILFLIFILLFLGLYIYKSHDDFSYYHLTYALSLTENKFIFGVGNLGHGFRTFSSLFFFHSILFLPAVEFYLFNLGPFLILLFVNIALVLEINKKAKANELDYKYFFSLLVLAFVNIIFYRIGEHGTDRSAQILLFLVFMLFVEVLFIEKKTENKKKTIELIILLIIFSASIKALFVIYLGLIPYLIYKLGFKKIISINIKFYLILSISLSSIFMINFFNTGCLLYPAKETCSEKVIWHIPKQEVSIMNTHYEWWAKAGGGPNYKSKLKKKDYINNFNWISNWVDRHFVGKVTDTLLGIFTICLLVFILFYRIRDEQKKNKKNFDLKIVYFFICIFFVEWFLKHPSLRYGGFVLFGLIFFVALSNILSKYHYKKSKIIFVNFLILTIIFGVYNLRNIKRINKEINIYSYDVKNSPFFYVEKNESKIIHERNDFKIYAPIQSSCWALNTPCTNYINLTSKKKLNFNIIYRND